MTEQEKNQQIKERWLLASTLFNLFLASSKLAWGFVIGSTLIKADAIHSFSDVIGAFLIFVAIRLVSHKSRLFPTGMPKLENLAAFFAGIGIFLAGYEVVRTVFFESGIKTPESMLSTLIIIIVATVMEVVFYWFELRTAKRINSPGLTADAINWLGDIGAAAVVIVGIIAHMAHIQYAQEVAVIVVVGMIVYGGYKVLRDAILSLLDASVEADILDRARGIILNVPGVVAVNRLSLHRTGSSILGSCTIEVDEKTTAKAHSVTFDVEKAMHNQFDNLERISIHYEPSKTKGSTIARLLDEAGSKSIHFGDTHTIVMETYNSQNELVSTNPVPNPFQGAKGKGIRLAAWLVQQKVDAIDFDPSFIESDIATLIDALGMSLINPKQI